MINQDLISKVSKTPSAGPKTGSLSGFMTSQPPASNKALAVKMRMNEENVKFQNERAKIAGPTLVKEVMPPSASAKPLPLAVVPQIQPTNDMPAVIVASDVSASELESFTGFIKVNGFDLELRNSQFAKAAIQGILENFYDGCHEQISSSEWIYIMSWAYTRESRSKLRSKGPKGIQLATCSYTNWYEVLTDISEDFLQQILKVSGADLGGVKEAKNE